jgi:hypothetical protein
VCTSRKKGGLQTWQPNNRQTASRPEQNLTAEVKIRQLRKLFADAPEVGKTVLENVLQRFASDASKAPPSGAGWQCLRPDWAGGCLLILHSMTNRTLGYATRCRCFPGAGTYTVTAKRLSLHKNGVQYCIRKAEESLRGRIDDCRADPRACPVSLPISWPCGTSAI